MDASEGKARRARAAFHAANIMPSVRLACDGSSEAVHPSGGCFAKVRMTVRMPPGDSHGPTWITCGMNSPWESWT